MLFAVDFLNRMEAKYPGVLSEIQESKFPPELILRQRMIPVALFSGMIALSHWRKDKVIYNFNQQIAVEILEQTDTPDKPLPLVCMRQLPYSCIAIHVSPIAIVDPSTQATLESYSGNAFLWIEGEYLCSAWQTHDDAYLAAHIKMKDGLTVDDMFVELVESNLSLFSTDEITEIKKLLGVKSFSELQFVSHDGLRRRFGSRFMQIMNAFRIASVQEILLQRALRVILYLGCENADIESAEEKLKSGAWSSFIGGTPRYVKKTERKAALNEIKKYHVMDVGYRIAGNYTRSFSSTASKVTIGTGRTQGYGKRRAHFHHFWIGPKNGIIASDIMNPQEGERGLRLRWVASTEIHPELRDEDATLINVE